MRLRYGKGIVLLLALWLALGGSLAAMAPLSLGRTHLAGRRSMLIYVRDQYDQLIAGAEIEVRERYTYRLVGDVTTNQHGYAQMTLDTATWYVVQAYYYEYGSKELWTYKYIGPDDWGSIYPYGIKTLRRDDPWIDQVTLPTDQLMPGRPALVSASIAHALTQTNYGLFCRMMLLIDDDGELPYLYQSTSDEQLVADGFEPFVFAPVLAQPGDYVVRLVLERRFEQNAWEVADEGGWSWQVTVRLEGAPLEGLVYLDWDGDGAQGHGEPPAPDTLVQLYSAQGDLIGQALSDAQGRVDLGERAWADYVLLVADLPSGLGRPRPAYPVSLNADSLGQIAMLPLDPWRVRLPWVQTH